MSRRSRTTVWRTISVLAILAGVVASCALGLVVRGVQQQRLVDAIRRSGGCVDDYEPNWLSKLFGDERLADVAGITLHGKVADAQISALVPCDTVVGLRADNCAIGDRAMEHIGQCRKLEDLSLRATDITDNGLRCLKDLANLKWLYLYNDNVSDNGLRYLATCKSLTILDATGTYVTREGADRLKAALPNLAITWSTIRSEEARRAIVELSQLGLGIYTWPWPGAKRYAKCLYDVEFPEDWEGDIHAANRLLKSVAAAESVGIRIHAARTAILDVVRDLPRIEMLHLASPAICDDDLVILKSVRVLRDVSIAGEKITDKGLGIISAILSLECVSFSLDCAITDVGLEQLANAPKLTEVHLWSRDSEPGTVRQFRDDTLTHLTKLPHLRKLLVASQKVTNRGVLTISKLASLESLLLECNATDDGIEPLKDLPRLRQLILQGPRFTEAALSHVARLKQLKRLNIQSSFTPDAAQRFQAAHPSIELFYDIIL
jgi:hypothetical protein